MSADATEDMIRRIVRSELARVGLRPAPPTPGGWRWDTATDRWMPLTARDEPDAGTGTGLTVL